MKKIFIIIAIIVVIIVGLGFWYLSSKTNYSVIQEENKEYEAYKDQNVYGLDVATVINKAVDRNTKNKIEKDDKGYFIQNDKNSIEVEINMIDNEETYKMETLFNAGTEQFVQYYGSENFRCSKIEYHKKTGRIKYILFEQQ